MSTNHFEPLRHFYKTCEYDPLEIKKIIIGERYTAVLLTNGNIGVCANLDYFFKNEQPIPADINLYDTKHRIIYTAYLNALFNYENHYEDKLDIFSAIDFSKYHNSVMIGYFMPLVKKFDEAEIKLSVFDMLVKNERLTTNDEKEKYVAEADCLIVSATTIMNSTLWDLLSQTNKSCDIYLLGPTSIMHPDMFIRTNIKTIFGAVFKPNDEMVLKMIKDGYGTRDFIKYGTKVVFQNTK